jgi:hypothetical protein
MIRKYLHHTTTIGLKYFFDLDLHTMTHSLAFVIVAVTSLKIIGYWMVEEFHEGIHTIKYDYIIIKEQFTRLAKKWDNNGNNIFAAILKN